MGSRLFATSILLLAFAGIACSHADPEPAKVPPNYPQPGILCDTQLLIREPEVQLTVPHIRQSPIAGADPVGWTAALASVSSYLGHPMSPCQIASLRPDLGYYCCHRQTPDNAGLIASCNTLPSLNDIEQVMRNLELHALRLDRPLSERELRTEISNGRPILIVKESQMLVITGYTGPRYHLLDPSLNGKISFATYQGLLGGPYGGPAWHMSWTALSFRLDSCNPRFSRACACGR